MYSRKRLNFKMYSAFLMISRKLEIVLLLTGCPWKLYGLKK